jgi:hypothetical protein
MLCTAYIGHCLPRIQKFWFDSRGNAFQIWKIFKVLKTKCKPKVLDMVCGMGSSENINEETLKNEYRVMRVNRTFSKCGTPSMLPRYVREGESEIGAAVRSPNASKNQTIIPDCFSRELQLCNKYKALFQFL